MLAAAGQAIKGFEIGVVGNLDNWTDRFSDFTVTFPVLRTNIFCTFHYRQACALGTKEELRSHQTWGMHLSCCPVCSVMNNHHLSLFDCWVWGNPETKLLVSACWPHPLNLSCLTNLSFPNFRLTVYNFASLFCFVCSNRYGDQGHGGVIPPDSWLVIEVELMSVGACTWPMLFFLL